MNSWSPTLLGAFLTGLGPWSVRLDPSAVEVKRYLRPTVRLSLLEVQDSSAKEGIAWTRVVIQLRERQIALDGIPNGQALTMVSSIQDAIRNALRHALSSASAPLVRWFQERVKSFPPDRWISHD